MPFNEEVELAIDIAECRGEDPDVVKGVSMLEVITAGDELQVAMICIGSSGHESYAENTELEVCYF